MSPWKSVARAIARMEAKPVRLKDAAEEARRQALILAQTAYDRDPEEAAACVHLQPIERTMRAAGLKVKLLGASEWGPIVQASCRINQAELTRVFALPSSIYYREGYLPERSPRDNPRADIFCAECLKTDRARCDILVLHPDECREDTPWFPAPP